MENKEEKKEKEIVFYKTKSNRNGNIPYLIKALQNKILTPEQLDIHTKRCIAYYLLDNMDVTQAQIANLLHVIPNSIYKMNVKRKRNYSYLANDIDLKAIVGHHIHIANHISQKLAKQQDWAGVWKVQRELIQDLQSLGYLKRIPDELKVTLQDRAADLARIYGVDLIGGKVIAVHPAIREDNSAIPNPTTN